MPDGSFAQIGSVVSWTSVRSEPWQEPALPPTQAPGSLQLVSPHPMLGVVCLMFAVGPGVPEWSERLHQSDWYAALRPRPSDLSHRGAAKGFWTTLPYGFDGNHPLAQANKVVALFPGICLATVALMDGASPAEIDVALCLVKTLVNWVREGGRRLRVIVTVGASEAERAAVVPLFQQVGATVIRGTAGMEPDHLHHFPVRATLRSPSGRLVCVDLADCLMCWPAGRVGDLHLIPFNAEAANQALQDIVVPHRPITLTLIAHFPEDGPDSTLSAIDTLAGLCSAHLFKSEQDTYMLFTTGGRLDGVTGTADLLLIHDEE